MPIEPNPNPNPNTNTKTEYEPNTNRIRITDTMFSRVRTYLSLVRFSHSVFALPFALTGALLAARHHPVTWPQIAWIVVAMVAARSAAMAFNRLVDARFDAGNPRTAMREIPRGSVSRARRASSSAIATLVFVSPPGSLGPVCFVLSPVALAIVFWYSLAKRYTTWTQAFLGLAMAVAPVGGWLAAGGRQGWEPWLLAWQLDSGSVGSTCSMRVRTSSTIAHTACDRSPCALAWPSH